MVVLRAMWTYKIDAGRPIPIQTNASQLNSIQLNSLQSNSIQSKSIQFNSIQSNSTAHLVLTFFWGLENPEQMFGDGDVADDREGGGDIHRACSRFQGSAASQSKSWASRGKLHARTHVYIYIYIYIYINIDTYFKQK